MKVLGIEALFRVATACALNGIQTHAHTGSKYDRNMTPVANVNKLGSCYQFPLLVAGNLSSRCDCT